MHLFRFQVQEILPRVKLSLARNFVLLHVTNRIAIKILKINEAVSKQIDWVNELTHKTSFPKQLQVNLPCHALQTSRREANVIKMR